MQFSRLTILVLAAFLQAAWAAPCARDSAGTSAPTAAKPARPAPMPFFRPGYTRLEAEEERVYDFQNGDAADDDEPRYAQEVLRASAPPPPLMRMVAERRTSRY